MRRYGRRQEILLCRFSREIGYQVQFLQISSVPRLSLNQIQWLRWIALYCGCGRMPYGKSFVETDDVDWWFLRSSSNSVFFMVSPSYFFIVFPKSLWAYGFALGGGCGRQGTSGGHPRVSCRDRDIGV